MCITCFAVDALRAHRRAFFALTPTAPNYANAMTYGGIPHASKVVEVTQMRSLVLLLSLAAVSVTADARNHGRGGQGGSRAGMMRSGPGMMGGQPSRMERTHEGRRTDRTPAQQQRRNDQRQHEQQQREHRDSANRARK